MRVLAACFAATLLAGCRHQPRSYTVVPKGTQLIVNPPVRAAAEIAIPHARRSRQPGCDITGDFMSLTWQGSTARLRLAASDGDPGAPDRMFTDTAKSLDDFRSALFADVDKGCLTAAERSRLLTAIVERFSLSTMIAYQLRLGSLIQAGFVELTPDFRLRVVSPLPSGFEVAFYSIQPAPTGDRVRIAPDSFTTNPPGMAPVAPLSIPAVPSYFRVLFWTSRSSANHYATILAAADRPALENSTREFQAQPDGSCRIKLDTGVTCIPLPPQWAVNAELRVRVNGADTYVGLHATVGQAVGNQAHLKVMRMFRGRLIPVTGTNLASLVLMPGDEIAF